MVPPGATSAAPGGTVARQFPSGRASWVMDIRPRPMGVPVSVLACRRTNSATGSRGFSSPRVRSSFGRAFHIAARASIPKSMLALPLEWRFFCLRRSTRRSRLNIFASSVPSPHGRRLLNGGVPRTGDIGISGAAHVPPIPRRDQAQQELSLILPAQRSDTGIALDPFARGARGRFFQDGNKLCRSM